MSLFRNVFRPARAAQVLGAFLLALALAAGGAGALRASPADNSVTAAIGSAVTTLDPYDASDTLSQAVAKSFYEGLYGFDRNMKRIPVLAESV